MGWSAPSFCRNVFKPHVMSIKQSDMSCISYESLPASLIACLICLYECQKPTVLTLSQTKNNREETVKWKYKFRRRYTVQELPEKKFLWVEYDGPERYRLKQLHWFIYTEQTGPRSRCAYNTTKRQSILITRTHTIFVATQRRQNLCSWLCMKHILLAEWRVLPVLFHQRATGAWSECVCANIVYHKCEII